MALSVRELETGLEGEFVRAKAAIAVALINNINCENLVANKEKRKEFIELVKQIQATLSSD